MKKTFAQSSAAIEAYATALFKPQDKVLREIIRRATAAGLPPIQVSPMDGLHLEILTRAAGAKKALEIGTLAGYSGVCIARGLARGGRLTTLEFSGKHAGVAAESFRRAGLSKNVTIVVGPALESLRKLEAGGPYDLVFIDADKENYPAYLAWAARHLRVGGIFLADNTFAWGEIVDSKSADPKVRALRRTNRLAAQSPRFRSTILPTGEGLSFGVKVR